MSAADGYLNIGTWQERSRVNGPGERFVIWLQGCLLHCPGCFNQEYWSPEKYMIVSVDELAARILNTPGIEGVTFTGGEPTLQAQGLARLCEQLKPAGLTVVCYSGYYLEVLQNQDDPWRQVLFGYVDILIDGPYIQEQAEPLRWRGSRNQHLHFFTDVYRHLADQAENSQAEVEFSVGQAGFTTSGIWPPGFLEKLDEVLRR